MLAEDVSPSLQLKTLRGSLLKQACVSMKPGKGLNDRIMLAKLEEEMRPLQKRACQLIRRLERQDFYEMLLELDMLIGPVPSKRDELDA